MPARVSQEQTEKGLHHGEVVSAGSPHPAAPGVLVPPKPTGGFLAEMGVPGGWLSPEGGDTPSDPLLSPCSGQKYLTAVVKLLGPLTRNYYIRAVLHAA